MHQLILHDDTGVARIRLTNGMLLLHVACWDTRVVELLMTIHSDTVTTQTNRIPTEKLTIKGDSPVLAGEGGRGDQFTASRTSHFCMLLYITPTYQTYWFQSFGDT